MWLHVRPTLYLLDRIITTFCSSLCQLNQYNPESLLSCIIPMAELGIDIKIGLEGNEEKQLYKHIEVTVELHQEKLAKISQDLCATLSKTSPPFIVIEYPHASFQNIDIFNFKAKDYESNYHSHSHKLYQFANPRSKDTIKLIKNLDKEFQRITKLDNSCQLKLSLYNPQLQEHPVRLLDRAKIKGHAETDPELVTTLTEVIRRISNEFLNSPIMAFVQLFQQFSFKIYRLEKTELFPEDLTKKVLQLCDFREWVHKHNLDQLINAKGDIFIYITIPKLLCLKIKSEASTLGLFLANFS